MFLSFAKLMIATSLLMPAVECSEECIYDCAGHVCNVLFSPESVTTPCGQHLSPFSVEGIKGKIPMSRPPLQVVVMMC